MAKAPLIAIIVPTYNCGNYLKRCLTSVLNQRSVTTEIIVVDDGSDDETPTILSDFMNYIRYVKQTNMGVANARNVGIDHARSEWVLFLDADDYLDDSALFHLFNGADNDCSGVVYGDWTEVDCQENFIARHRSRDCFGAPPLPALANFGGAAFPPGCAIVRRNLASRIKFRQLTSPCEDRDFWIRCGLESCFKRVDTNVLFYRNRPNSHSKNRKKQVIASIIVRLYASELFRTFFKEFYNREMDPQYIVEQTLWDVYWQREWEIVSEIINLVDKFGISTQTTRLIRQRLRYWKWLIVLKDYFETLIRR